MARSRKNSSRKKKGSQLSIILALKPVILRQAASVADADWVADVETLITELEPNRCYSAEFLLHQLEGPFTFDGRLAADFPPIQSEVAQAQLRELIEAVTHRLPIPIADAPEEVLELKDIAAEYNVSTKTVYRWRNHGLVARYIAFPDSKRLAVFKSSFHRFLKDHGDLVQRGSGFRQGNDEERKDVVRRARQLVDKGLSRGEIVRALAAETNRCEQTIRTMLARHDQDQPDDPVFSDDELDGRRSAQAIYEALRNGESVKEIAGRVRITVASAQRIIRRKRFEQICNWEVGFVESDEFKEPDADAKILLAPMPRLEPPKKPSHNLPEPTNAYFDALWQYPVLTRGQERILFRRYNYIKYKLVMLRQRLQRGRVSSRMMDEIESLYEQALDIRTVLSNCNLRLVVFIAKRFAGTDRLLDELISDGNWHLTRAIENFDYTKGWKFSTYAMASIASNFARRSSENGNEAHKLQGYVEHALSKPDASWNNHVVEQMQWRCHCSDVDKLLAHLPERERFIIVRRFGLGKVDEPETLKEVGDQLNITKERVRQLEARAIEMLRAAAQSIKLASDDSVYLFFKDKA